MIIRQHSYTLRGYRNTPAVNTFAGIAFIFVAAVLCLLLLSGCSSQSVPDTQEDIQAQQNQVQSAAPTDAGNSSDAPSDASKTDAPETSATNGKHASAETSSWIVPDGFEAVDMGTPPSGVRYVYRNSNLNMTITVWESSINYLPFSSTDEWLENDYNEYMNGAYGDAPSYDLRNSSEIVVSGYKSDGSVYYIMEAAASPKIYSVTFEYPSGSNKETCDKVVAQFMDNYSYQK